MSYYKSKRNKDKTRRQRLVLGWAKKLKAIDALGGKCECGEQRPWLLEFHHREETEKEGQISSLKHYSWDKLCKELDKCQLVCRNCHGDIHFKQCFLELEQEIRTKVVEGNFSRTVDHNAILELNTQGVSQAAIAKRLNCGISTVCEILKSNGIHTFEKKKVVDPLEVIKLRELGFTNAEIGVKLGIHRYTVPQVIRRWKNKNDPKSS